MTTTIVAALLSVALCGFGGGAWAAAAAPPAAPAPSTGASMAITDAPSPGGSFGPSSPGALATPPAASSPAPLPSPYPSPYHSQIPETSPLGSGTGGTPNPSGTVGGPGTALPPAP